MLSLVSVNKMQRTTLKERLHLCSEYKAVLTGYEESFGKIDIYSLFYYRDKDKALKKLSDNCQKSFYLNSEKIPCEYSEKLLCEKLLEKLKNRQKSANVCLHFLPEYSVLLQLCRYSSKVYICGFPPPDFLDEIWKNCGTIPFFGKPCTDTTYTLKGNEVPVINKLPKPFDNICPKDFSPTLFAGLLYKENGVFLK